MSAPANPLRNLIDPVSSRTVEHPVRNGAILLIVGLLVVLGAVTHKLPLIDSQSGYTIRADFAFVNNVNNRTPVRVDGANVGIVTSIGAGPDPRRSSELKMLITYPGLVVHSDAGASIRWRTVLGGPMYVDLDPGSAGAPKLGDGVIPVSRTSSQVEIDDVLRIYNGNTAQAQRDTLKGLAQGFSAPAATGTTIESLSDLRQVGQGLAPYEGTDAGDLSRLVATTATTAKALSANVNALQTLVTGARQTLGATDAQAVPLGQAIELSPGTLDSTEVTMNRLRTTLNHLDPLVTHLLLGASLIASASDAAQPALDQANSLLREARPLLRNARPTFANLRAASTAGVPILNGLEPTFDRLNTDILPWLGRRDSDTRLLNYEAIGPTFSVLDEAAGGYDSEGYRLYLSTLAASNSVIDEGILNDAKGTFTSQCEQVADALQRARCPTVVSALTAMLFGGKQ
jgi:ABC-type transporter Mla subunit MlaD